MNSSARRMVGRRLAYADLTAPDWARGTLLALA